jgi:hypothetical protein
MKVALYTIGVLSLVAFLFSQSGCSTEQPGATDTLGTYSVNVDSTPDKVTDAANKACQDLKLSDINSNGSKVDGRVVARTAQGDDVTINIEQAGDNVSKVSVRVGSTGDQSISKQLVDRIKSHLSWL